MQVNEELRIAGAMLATSYFSVASATDFDGTVMDCAEKYKSVRIMYRHYQLLAMKQGLSEDQAGDLFRVSLDYLKQISDRVELLEEMKDNVKMKKSKNGHVN